MENDNQFEFYPLENRGINLTIKTFEKVEWVFQFNDGEPVRFAEATDGTKEVTLTLSNRSDANIEFGDGKGNKFKIFARELK